MKMAGMTLSTVQMELQRVKMMPGVMTEAYLECLNKYVRLASRDGTELTTNRMIEPLAIFQGMMGLRMWLAEVQVLMTKLKQRSFQGAPL